MIEDDIKACLGVGVSEYLHVKDWTKIVEYLKDVKGCVKKVEYLEGLKDCVKKVTNNS